MPVKLENAGVEALLHVMVRETAQFEMLGALVKKLDIEDAYARLESVVADIDCAMSRGSDSNALLSMFRHIQHAGTGSRDDANICDVDNWKGLLLRFSKMCS